MGKRRKPATMLTDLFVFVVFFAGLAVFTYPFVARAVNQIGLQLRLSRDHAATEQNVARQEAKRKKQNEFLSKYGLRPNTDIFRQSGTGIQSIKALQQHLIGEVTIPKLYLSLPLYDTTSEELLQLGAVVLPGTSFPTGGKNTHTVISAHSGIPSKTLFNNLHRMKKGRQFILTVGKKHLAYQVKWIRTIEANDTRALQIRQGEDVATLMTCTPIGINSHRLLVTGVRVPYTKAEAQSVKKTTDHVWMRNLVVILASLLALLIFILLLIRIVKRHRRQ